jgi:1,4-dihydroxy-2-naphthoate polyprenyltransferase
MTEDNAAAAAASFDVPPKWRLMLQELRVPFFTASIVPVLLGSALAARHTGLFDWALFFCTLVGVVLVHAGANVLNDYFDHLSGNDEANVEFVRPFTGGSRLIQRGLLSPDEVLGLGIACLAAGAALGAYLCFRVGWPLVWLGVAGIAGGVLYSAPPVALGSRGLGEPVIALNFGVLPVLGAYMVQTHRFNWEAVWVSLPVALLIAAVLFINQFQDFRADRAVGKRNWVVRLGRQRAVHVYGILMTVWMLPVLLGVVFRALPAAAGLALLVLVPAVRAILTARRHCDAPVLLAPTNASTILVHLTVGLLLSASLVIGW